MVPAKEYTAIYGGQPITASMDRLVNTTGHPRSTIIARIRRGQDIRPASLIVWHGVLMSGEEVWGTIHELRKLTGLPPSVLYYRLEMRIPLDKPKGPVAAMLHGILMDGTDVWGTGPELSRRFKLRDPTVRSRIKYKIPLDRPVTPRKPKGKASQRVKKKRPPSAMDAPTRTAALDRALQSWTNRAAM